MIKIKAGQTYKTKNGDNNMTLYRQRDFGIAARKRLIEDGKTMDEAREIVNKIFKRYNSEKLYLYGIAHDAKWFTFNCFDRDGNSIDGDGFIYPESHHSLKLE